MNAEVMVKPTSHEMECIVCGVPVLKGQRVIKVTHKGFRSHEVGYICRKHMASSAKQVLEEL